MLGKYFWKRIRIIKINGMQIVEKIKEDLIRRIDVLNKSIRSESVGALNELKDALSHIEYLEKEDIPEYSYNETTYHVGKQHKWNVGDELAYYMFTSDEEGEFVIGTITSVEMGVDDWVYTFDGNHKDEYTECELIYSEAYKKNRPCQKK